MGTNKTFQVFSTGSFVATSVWAKKYLCHSLGGTILLTADVRVSAKLNYLVNLQRYFFLITMEYCCRIAPCSRKAKFLPKVEGLCNFDTRNVKVVHSFGLKHNFEIRSFVYIM